MEARLHFARARAPSVHPGSAELSRARAETAAESLDKIIGVLEAAGARDLLHARGPADEQAGGATHALGEDEGRGRDAFAAGEGHDLWIALLRFARNDGWYVLIT